jgi:two-component system, chemotaxis family, chemotaxis protein CheY
LKIHGSVINLGKRILVVDDSLVMRRMIQDILTKAGYQIVGMAKDTSEALQKFQETMPDLVTMDIVMPGERGLSALKRILEIDARARVIIVSGLHQKSIFQEAMQLGAKEYVVKPFEEEDLLKAVAGVLG